MALSMEGGPSQEVSPGEGHDRGFSTTGAATETASKEREERADDIDLPEEMNGNIYRGILWMKEKYEQYRDLADRRYEQLKEELARSEKKYEDLVASGEVSKGPIVAGEPGRLAADRVAADGDAGVEAVQAGAGDESLLSDAEKASVQDIVEEKNRQIRFLQDELDQRIKNYHQLEYQGRDNKSRLEELERRYAAAQESLEERQRTIDEMDGWLVIERNKVEELVAKLQNNSLLLMNIYKELDKSLNLEGSPGKAAEGATTGV